MNMKPLLGPVVVAALLAVSIPVFAQQGGQAPRPAPQAQQGGGARLSPAVIAVVDMQVVMRETIAAKSIRDQIERQRQTYQTDITKRENELRAQEQELGRQRTLLSADAFAERRRGFETQVGDFQKQLNARKRQLEQAYADNMKQVETALARILEQLASERGLSVILPKQATLLSANALDITRDVQTRIDRDIPRVTVRLPPLQN